MDRGLPDLPFQFPEMRGSSTVEGTVRSICTTQMCLLDHQATATPCLDPGPHQLPVSISRNWDSKGTPGSNAHSYTVDKC